MTIHRSGSQTLETHSAAADAARNPAHLQRSGSREGGHQRQRTVFALPKLTISDDKVLLVEIIEKNGARHQTIEIPSREILNTKVL